MKIKNKIVIFIIILLVAIAFILSLEIGISSAFIIDYIEEKEITKFVITKKIDNQIVAIKELDFNEIDELVNYLKDIRLIKVKSSKIKYSNSEMYEISGRNTDGIEYLILKCRELNYCEIIGIGYPKVYIIKDNQWIEKVNGFLNS